MKFIGASLLPKIYLPINTISLHLAVGRQSSTPLPSHHPDLTGLQFLITDPFPLRPSLSHIFKELSEFPSSVGPDAN